MSNSSNSSESPTAPTLAFLDGTRALAALFVVAHHVYLHPPGADAGRDIYRWSGPQKMLGVFWWGHFAVSFFIVLSGFCLAIAPAKRDALPSWKEFLSRRTRRILPPYFTALAFSLLLIWAFVGHKSGTHWDTSLPVSPRSILCRLLLVNAFGPNDGAINHVFWSIAVEWHLYFLFLPLLFFARRFGWRKALFAITTLSFVAARVALNRLETDASFSFLALFGFGMTGAHVAFSPRLETLRARINWPLWSAVSALVFVAIVEVPPLFGRELPFHQLDFVAGVCAAFLLVTLCEFPTSRLSRVLSSPLLVRIGGFSYSLYLLHAPLIQVAWQLGINHIENPRVEFWALLASSLALSLPVSYGFHLVFERPFMPHARQRHDAAKSVV